MRGGIRSAVLACTAAPTASGPLHTDSARQPHYPCYLLTATDRYRQQTPYSALPLLLVRHPRLPSRRCLFVSGLKPTEPRAVVLSAAAEFALRWVAGQPSCSIEPAAGLFLPQISLLWTGEFALTVSGYAVRRWRLLRDPVRQAAAAAAGGESSRAVCRCRRLLLHVVHRCPSGPTVSHSHTRSPSPAGRDRPTRHDSMQLSRPARTG